MKYYVILGILFLLVLSLFVRANRGIDPRWSNSGLCTEVVGKEYCVSYTVPEGVTIPRSWGEKARPGWSAGEINSGSIVYYSPSFDQGPVFTNVLVVDDPINNPRYYVQYIVRKDALPPLP